MRVQCKNCLPKEGIDIPDFSQPEKSTLLQLTKQSPIHSTKHIMDHFSLSHRDAKYIVTHINIPYSHCHHCKFDKLTGEYINCPECGALNFNWRGDS
jgi:hypothetical protein